MYGVFTYIWLIFMVNVCKYTSPMDPIGCLSHLSPQFQDHGESGWPKSCPPH